MNVDREYFYELIDKIPEEKLPELRIVLLKMAIPEEEPTSEEIEAIERGLAEVARGEVYSLEEVFWETRKRDTEDDEIQSLYYKLIDMWNNRDAQGMADLFAEQGVQIGFDGSKVVGKSKIFSHVAPIFENHPTAPFITKVKSVRPLGTDAAILHAIAGMIPPGKTDIEPNVNAHQTLVAVKQDEGWQIELFQNTPAQFHGRTELVEQMTGELRQVL